MIYTARSNTRVDLAGGTLDLWPLSQLVSKASTINASISCYTYASFEPSSNLEVEVESPDFKETFSLDSVEELLSSSDSKLSLLKEAFSLLKGSEGVGKWSLKSESPAGSGLGGSSSLLISILKVIFQIKSWQPTEKKLIEAAKNIETRVLKASAGIQDYFSPVQSGLNLIEYSAFGYKRESLNEVLDFWSESFLILDSEIKHHSGMNNWEILKAYIDGDQKVVKALEGLSQVVPLVKEALLSKDKKSLSQAFAKELEARKSVSSSYINEELQAYLNKLEGFKEIKALKVCGAGGGGCVLALVGGDKEQLKKDLKLQGLKVLNFHMTV